MKDKREAIKAYLESLKPPAGPAAPAVPAGDGAETDPDLPDLETDISEGEEETLRRNGTRLIQFSIVVVLDKDTDFSTHLASIDRLNVKLRRPDDGDVVGLVSKPGCLVVFDVGNNAVIPFKKIKQWTAIAKAASALGGTVAIRMPAGVSCWQHKGIAALIMDLELQVDDDDKRPYLMATNNSFVRRSVGEKNYFSAVSYTHLTLPTILLV